MFHTTPFREQEGRLWEAVSVPAEQREARYCTPGACEAPWAARDGTGSPFATGGTGELVTTGEGLGRGSPQKPGGCGNLDRFEVRPLEPTHSGWLPAACSQNFRSRHLRRPGGHLGDSQTRSAATTPSPALPPPCPAPHTPSCRSLFTRVIHQALVPLHSVSCPSPGPGPITPL